MDSIKQAADVDHIDDTTKQRLAHLANREDHEIGKWRAIRQNPRAFLWCLYAVWTVLCVSFENQASGTVMGIPEFRKDFGFYYNGDYVLSTQWQGAFSGAPVASLVLS